MAELTSSWVGPNKNVFLSIPEIAPLMPHIAAAHDGVLSVKSGTTPQSPEDKERIALQKQTDHLHDHAYRAVRHLHQAWREWLLAQDPVDMAHVHAIDTSMNLLQPTGAAGTNEPYLAEAGAAQRAKKMLTGATDVTSTLSKMTLGKGVSAMDVLNLWFEHAEKLGELEASKSSSVPQNAASGKTILAARHDWLKIVNTVLANLEQSKAPAENIQAIRGPVDAAADRAYKRYLESRKNKAAPNP